MNTIVSQSISPAIVARFVRIHPQTWHGHISMRVEFYGCYKGNLIMIIRTTLGTIVLILFAPNPGPRRLLSVPGVLLSPTPVDFLLVEGGTPGTEKDEDYRN